MTTSQVQLVINGVDNASKVLQGVGKTARSISKEFEKFGKVMSVGASLAGGAFLALGGFALKTADDFEKTSLKYKVLLKSQEEATKRMDELIAFAKKTPFELKEISKADVILQGFGIRSEKVLETIGNAAAVNEENFAELALIMGQLSQSKDLENIKQLVERGVISFNELSDAGIKFAKDRSIVNSVEETYGAVVSIMENKFAGGMAELSNTLTGKIAILKDTFSLAMVEIANKTGLLDKAKGFVNDFTQIIIENKDSIISLVENGLNYLFETVSYIWEFIQPAVDAFVKWGMEGDNFKNLFLGMLTAVGVGLAFFVGGFLVAQATVIAIFAGITGTVLLFKKAWDNNWFGIQEKVQLFFEWLLMAYDQYIVPFVAFMNQAIKNIADWWSQNGESIMGVVGNTFSTVAQIIGGVIKIILEITKQGLESIEKFWNENGKNIIAFVEGFWKVVAGNVKIALSLILGIIKTVLAIISGDWAGAWNAIKEMLAGVWEGMRMVVDGKLKQISAMLQGGWSLITSTATNAWNNLVNQITSIFDGVLGPIKSVIDTITGWINNIMNKIKDAKSAASSIEKNAFGGPVTQGVPTVVGERGPEVFVPSQSGSIKTMDQVETGGGGGVTININNPTVRSDNDLRLMALELEKVLSQNNLISKQGIAVG